MAHMNQNKKAVIAAELKKIVPAGWKYSLSVSNHMTIVMTIKQAPVDLIRALGANQYFNPETEKSASVNVYHYDRQIVNEEVRAVISKIIEALNISNWNRSDWMSDYHDVGHYVELNFGRWDKPFVCIAELEAA